MTLTDRVSSFITLGEALRNMAEDEFKALAQKASAENGWFTERSVQMALQGVQILLQGPQLKSWAASYPEIHSPKTVGLAMAGNIPLVGFHDFLSVLVAGHRLRYKPSSKDTVLLDFIRKRLIEVEPRFGGLIETTDRLNAVDAVIATGSDNTSRYFEYYFRNIPHIIRKNRVSCAVIEGDEPTAEIEKLGTDIFSYYGLGCRNVSTVFVPRDYDLTFFLDAMKGFDHVLDNHKYENNYTYQKSLLMLNQEKFLDNGFLLLRANNRLISPVGVLHYVVYPDLAALKSEVSSYRDQLQVVVSANGWFEGSVPFGKAQFPGLNDYADGVDTMRFLTGLR
ncbi:MAG: acyl-CoA reductase [Cyclobacteriaceae bacterium]|nr:acyl-CoA reductase [Cyclobacteriaceae bacterium]